MFIVTLHEVTNKSSFCVFDKKHKVEITYISNDYNAAFGVAQSIADKHDNVIRVEPAGSAVTRWANGNYWPDFEIAILKVPEDKLMSVLAAPVIHDRYVE